MRRTFGLIPLVLLALAGIWFGGGEGRTGAARAPAPAGGDSSDDGYILALSWSPAWCEEDDPHGKTRQCAADADLGLVVHGLWAGSREDSRVYCRTGEPERLPADLARQVLTYMPSVGLARHEWKKHGSCMGLGQRGYFDTMERAWRTIRTPEALRPGQAPRQMTSAALRRDFLASNPRLPADSVRFQCDREGDFSEVRICLTSGLEGRACPSPARGNCPATISILPPP
jgi:ribonuclease T2